ncbi:MAG: YkgJ family cysteine cluster protein [Oleidesulfovibrio sp.]
MTPGNEELCFPLSPSEWKRIVDHCNDQGGFATQRNTQPFIDCMKRLFPADSARLEEVFPPHGDHLRLASDETGRCLFLTHSGCRLPREARPWYCRLFPFWFMPNGMLTMFTPDECLVYLESSSIREAMETMGVTENELRLIFGRLRLAWGLDPEQDEHGNQYPLCDHTL